MTLSAWLQTPTVPGCGRLASVAVRYSTEPQDLEKADGEALVKAVGRCSDDKSMARVGIHWATEQCRDLLDHKVRGIHFYTLNKSDATRQIYKNLGVKDSQALRVG